MKKIQYRKGDEKYMKKNNLFIKYFTSDELPFDKRILNFVCFFGALATFVTFIARIIGRMPIITILAMFFIFVVMTVTFIVSAIRAGGTIIITNIALYVLGLILLPIVFFTSGGAASGIAAYFVPIIILDFLLLKGAVRVRALVFTSAGIIFCYVSTLFWNWNSLPAEGLSTYQLFVDNIQSIFVSGFFMGSVIVFQNGVYLKEKSKAEAAGAEIMRSEELLTLVNEAATTLLSAEPDKFESALTESMKKIAVCLDIDCVYIWRLDEQNDIPIYIQLYDWFSSSVDKAKSFETVSGSNIIPRMAEWDEKLFGERGYMSELVGNFKGSVREKLESSDVKAVMAFPVFFQGNYWGFVSYENRHSDKLCSEREATILQSGSLLLINAVERNDNILQLNDRLAQQQLMSSISKSFISKESMGNLIRDALARMGDFLNVERILIAVLEKNSEISRPQYVWIVDPKYAPNPSQKEFSVILKELFPRYHNENDDIQGMYCDNAITYQDGKFKIFNDRAAIKSFICVPIYVDGELWGVMSVEAQQNFRFWSESNAQLVGMVSSAISNAVARDIMEKERATALEQAIAASRAKGDFLSNMSHEIRTPMNAIIGMTSIGKSSQTLEKKDYAFKKIDDASKHLLGVINDILDMSKIEANKLELSPVDFGFESMVQKVVNVINFRVDERRQHLYINIDNNIPRLLIGDDQRLAQVITNLLSNAVKFTPEEGSIYLDARLISEDDKICRLQIEVTDTGIGITEEQKARLFRSFEQAEAGTSRKYGGTGLGLAISKRIVELMGGEIWVESESGHGSKFAFTVNLNRTSKENKRLLLEGIDWDNIRVFAVDDELEIREFFMRTSANLGIYCDVAASGEEAVELINLDDDYNIFFVDWKLPGMNGIDLARKIREKTKHKSVVILFSSIDWSVVEDDARSAGIDKFLPKPLFQSSIIDMINECIGSDITTERTDGNDMIDDFTGYVVLLAEDMEINREIVLSLLEPTNLTVKCAENGSQAYKMFEDSPDEYDMIFMDVQMPEMDGYEATRRIRASNTQTAKEIPIVAMTANVFREDIELCIDAGMNAHIGKPINIDEVMNMLRTYLK